MNKVVGSLKEAILLCGLEDGMTVSFHHHLRNGDYVINMVMQTIAEMGFKNIRVATTALFPVHGPLVTLIRQGVIKSIDANGLLGGEVGAFISRGLMEEPFTMRSHGGRPNAIESGELLIDIAFIAAPSCDPAGNMNGVDGPSAFGSMGYAYSDAECARKVVAVTDNLVPFPLAPISIDQTRVDYVVKVDSLGDPRGIVSGITRITRDPLALSIAKLASKVIEHSGLLKDGFSFQTGASGTALAVAYYVKNAMKEKGVVGSFGMGGITQYFVEMLEEGLFQKLIDVQCFDLEAVKSIKRNMNHLEVSASFYANPAAKGGCAVDMLDAVILGATEIDTSFNVNVITDSSGFIIGAPGGHPDTAEGAKLAIIVAPLFRARLPIVVEKVHTITTPGSVVDVLVTEKGICVNPKNTELKNRLTDAGLPVIDIHVLQREAEKISGKPKPVKTGDKVVVNVIHRNGGIMDTIKNVL